MSLSQTQVSVITFSGGGEEIGTKSAKKHIVAHTGRKMQVLRHLGLAPTPPSHASLVVQTTLMYSTVKCYHTIHSFIHSFIHYYTIRQPHSHKTQ